MLGSLIAPRALEATLYQRDFESVRVLFAAVLEQERTTDEQIERAVTAQGMARAAELLTGQYTLVITNVPYLGRAKQGERLRSFCERRYPAAKKDLATVFLERCLELCGEGGTASLVLPQNWLGLTTYRKLRERLLKKETWHLLARLGPGAFETISGEVVKATLLALSRCKPTTAAQGTMYGMDVSEFRTASEKAAHLSEAEVKGVEQARQLENPDARIVFEDQASLPSALGDLSAALVGLQTSDDAMFVSAFWEQQILDKSIWEYMQSTPDAFAEMDGLSWLVKWEQGEGTLLSLPNAYPTKGLKAVGRVGIAIHRMGKIFAYRYGKERFHQNVAVIVPISKDHLTAIWCFCSSPEYSEAVRRIDQTLKVTNATLVTKVPFDLDRWTGRRPGTSS